MHDSLTVVIPSRDSFGDKYDVAEKIQKNSGCDVHILWVENPSGESLSKVYNSIITNNNIPDDVIVFMHDDVEILNDGWGVELLKLFSKHKDYGIIGVAGSGQFYEECAWWTYPDKYGQILYRNDGKEWLSSYSKLLKKDVQEVCVIDGCFIAINKLRISEMFDENIIGFCLYDSDFCLANFLSNETKIGVTSKIRICHNTHDEDKEEWKDNKNYIIEKYKDNFPIIIK